MSTQTQTQNAAPAQSATGAIHEITDASRQMFQAGERIAQNLDTLERRVEYATDWQARVAERPWLFIGGAILAGILLSRIFR